MKDFFYQCLLTSGWIILSACWSEAQQSVEKVPIWLDSVLHIKLDDQQLDSEKKSDLADSAFHVAGRFSDLCRQVHLRTRQATFLDNMGLVDSALQQLLWANKKFMVSCDSILLMSLLGNMTNIYLSLNELNRVDSVSRIALSMWNPAWQDKEPRFTTLTNQAIAYFMQEDTAIATRIFHQIYSEAVAVQDSNYILKSLLNLGTIHGLGKNQDSAYHFLTLATQSAKENSDMDNYISLLINLANLDMDRGHFQKSINLLDTAFQLATDLKNTFFRASVQEERSNVYLKKGDFRRAYEYLKDYVSLKEELLNEERVKSVTEMMEKYESEKKARQIQELEIDKLDATLQNERVTNARNRYLYIGAVILVLAVALWGRLRIVHRSQSAIMREKDISEGLLLNILPASVAQELKQKGYADAKQFESATIMFSDFKDFTQIAEELSAAELVEEINDYFRSFDNIMTRFGIEKIKTIGDAYMAAGSIPDTNTASAYDVVMAALEMQRVVIERKKERDLKHLPSYEMRIGIHTGPVVAGIVGVKKFQYDLWGDTVNIASRMESSGAPGKVNISEATYLLIKEQPNLVFTPRGKIYAKGKGEMTMYFVQMKDSVRQIG